MVDTVLNGDYAKNSFFRSYILTVGIANIREYKEVVKEGDTVVRAHAVRDVIGEIKTLPEELLAAPREDLQAAVLKRKNELQRERNTSIGGGVVTERDALESLTVKVPFDSRQEPSRRAIEVFDAENPNTISFTQHQIEFKTKKTESKSSGFTVIKLYNMSQAASDFIFDFSGKGANLKLDAGYIGNLSTVIHGTIQDVEETFNGPDKVTTFYVSEGTFFANSTFMSKTWAQGTPIDTVIDDVLAELPFTRGEVDAVTKTIIEVQGDDTVVSRGLFGGRTNAKVNTDSIAYKLALRNKTNQVAQAQRNRVGDQSVVAVDSSGSVTLLNQGSFGEGPSLPSEPVLLPNQFSIQGNAMAELGWMLNTYQRNITIDNMAVNVRSKTPNLAETVRQNKIKIVGKDSGLKGKIRRLSKSKRIGVNEANEVQGVKFKILLDASLVKGSFISLASDLPERGGNYSGLYRIEELWHTGNLEGGEWETEITASTVDITKERLTSGG